MPAPANPSHKPAAIQVARPRAAGLRRRPRPSPSTIQSTKHSIPAPSGHWNCSIGWRVESVPVSCAAIGSMPFVKISRATSGDSGA